MYYKIKIQFNNTILNIYLIQGHNIDLAATEDNIDVFLDDEKCNVTFIGTTIIICQPDRPEEDIKLQRLMVVRVSINALSKNV